MVLNILRRITFLFFLNFVLIPMFNYLIDSPFFFEGFRMSPRCLPARSKNKSIHYLNICQ